MSKNLKIEKYYSYICTYFPNEELFNVYNFLENVYNNLKCNYVIGQLELCPKTKKLHVQFTIHFKYQVVPSRIKKFNKRIHYKGVIIDNGIDVYCMKEKSRVLGPFEFGSRPIKRNNKDDWNYVRDLAKSGDLDKLSRDYPDIYVKYYGNLRNIAKDNLVFSDKDHVRGIWIYGEPGIGKSRYVRDIIPKKELYPKRLKTWWDGYRGQKYVVMDDFAPKHSEMFGDILKLWTDRYGLGLDIKGGCVVDNYEIFFITSQYTIDQCFNDIQYNLAIHRRFCEYHLSDILNKNVNDLINDLKNKV